jgi:hypothetical protein
MLYRSIKMLRSGSIFIIASVSIFATAAACVRPVWLLYALGGLLTGLGGRLLLAHMSKVLRLVAEFLSVALLVAFGLAMLFALPFPVGLITLITVIGTTLLLLHRVLRDARSRKRVVVELLVLGIALSIVGAFSLKRNFVPMRAPVPPALAHYSTRIDLSSERKLWTIRSTLEIRHDERSLMYGYRDRSFVTKISSALQQCGWTVAEGGASAIRERTQPAVSRWFPVTSLNTIPLEVCPGFSRESEVVLFAPKYAVRRSYPDAHRADLVSDNRERLTLLVDFAYDESPALQIELVSPLLRSAIGTQLLAGAFWTPLAWMWATLCGIFAQQIKEGLIVPMAKRSCRALGIRWQVGTKDSDSQDKPLIIIP